jgi:hypothetical protein
MAHELLYNCYGNYFDQCASYILKGQMTEAFAAMRTQIQFDMKKRKVGFYNSALQKELGSRKKNRKPKARNIYVMAALQRGFVLENIQTKEKIQIEPFQFDNLQDVLDLWLQHPTINIFLQKWKACKKKENFSLYTSFIRSLTGHRDKKTKKAVYTISGWRILGINLFNMENNFTDEEID